jgi:predicted DNA binding CopG/RHH family protein
MSRGFCESVVKAFEAEEKDAVVRLRLPRRLKVKAEAKARRQGMTMSSYLRTLVEADLRSR